ncbi:Glutamate--tRNA ligase [Anaplasma phagocytophilum]|uniref:glutamate--tRNA ligase n=1 Tax=Anaplasma phagocytophilum TaxID=948 RepID=UPI0007DE6E59|nr:glutamate--tRNA ligase [Anaplasma phagocytophilum]SCV64725.1 Glutamate--tRNA ligase [Anaplasma phagocytophilum]
MRVVTRFAPSPTGSLHLGGARTALFNWLFARHHKGKFLLRMEDTDKKRSSDVVAQSIIDDMSWLGLQHDGDIVVQSSRAARHVAVARELVELGRAYRCYCSEDEVNEQKLQSESTGKYFRHVCPWKHLNSTGDLPNKPYVVRLKSPENTTIEFLDGVYGKISVKSDQIDDMVILRSDGTPTYLLAVVVDDHDMEITHIIRGSDHITNTVKQIVLAEAMSWVSPKFFHIPLIHDENGAKLSKRNRAPGIHEYKEQGFLPEALCNYLLRMGWSYQNKEIVSMQEAIALFSMEDVGVSCSCLDYKKLVFLNHHYMGSKSESEILDLLLPILEEKLGGRISEEKLSRLSLGIKQLVERAKTLTDLAEDSLFYVQDVEININPEAVETIQNSKKFLAELLESMSGIHPDMWKKTHLSSQIKEFSKTRNLAMSDVYHFLRASITGRLQSPNISEVMEILGQEMCINRMLSAQEI